MQGRVNNPSAQGVGAFTSKKRADPKVPAINANGSAADTHQGKAVDDHATRKVEEGSSRRNITRKKTQPGTAGQYDSRNKKQGGAGKGK